MGLEVIAGAAVASALATGYQAVTADQAQKKTLRNQRVANQQAQNAARKQEGLAEESIARANKKTPDVAALLAEATTLKPPSTLLTGPSGLPSTNMLGY